jgi:hypothetical protein
MKPSSPPTGQVTRTGPFARMLVDAWMCRVYTGTLPPVDETLLTIPRGSAQLL